MLNKATISRMQAYDNRHPALSSSPENGSQKERKR
jgi:hypothetical protein